MRETRSAVMQSSNKITFLVLLLISSLAGEITSNENEISEENMDKDLIPSDNELTTRVLSDADKIKLLAIFNLIPPLVQLVFSIVGPGCFKHSAIPLNCASLCKRGTGFCAGCPVPQSKMCVCLSGGCATHGTNSQISDCVIDSSTQKYEQCQSSCHQLCPNAIASYQCVGPCTVHSTVERGESRTTNLCNQAKCCCALPSGVAGAGLQTVELEI